MKINFNMRLKVFLIIFSVCMLGIIFSTILIDRQIDKYISEIKTEVDINVEIVNNTDDKITVIKDGHDIKIQLDETLTIKDSVQKAFQVKVVSDSGLNIRQEPDIESLKVGTINYGHVIQVKEDCGDWYKTDVGYIYKEYTIKI
jgi:hypothetical protein